MACWVVGKNPVRVRRRLEEISSSLVSYCSLNYLAINEKKTQVLWAGAPGEAVQVGDCRVRPADEFEFLGVKFDRQLTVNPHLRNITSTARSLAIMARRLTFHLPAGVVRRVVGALVRGKLGYACLVLPPRMNEQDPVNTLMAKLQIAVNDVGRGIIGSDRSERKNIEEVLCESELPSINKMVVETIATETWKALNTRDAPGLPLTPLGTLMCSGTLVGKTRAAASGCIPPPAKKQVDSFIWWGYHMWNASIDLRNSPTLARAKQAAKALAQSSPL